MKLWWGKQQRQTLPVDERRWVVVDVESSGLDPTRDALLAIAVIAVQVDWPVKRMRIDAGDSCELVLRQDAASSRGNILLHGIGAQMQLAGLEPVAALQSWQRFAATSPVLAFHSAFDQTVLGRYCRRHLGGIYPIPGWI